MYTRVSMHVCVCTYGTMTSSSVGELFSAIVGFEDLVVKLRAHHPECVSAADAAVLDKKGLDTLYVQWVASAEAVG